MQIDKNRDYQVGPYTYRNFITLILEEKLLILRERNHPDVKKWMFTKEDIKEDSHLAYIEGLKKREDAFYWLMEREGKPVGVLSIIHCDYAKEEGEPGYYLFASEQEGGYGLEMQYYYKKFFFEELGLKNLFGHLLYGNTNAYLMSCFYGAVKDGEMEEDGRRYIVMHTPKENFERVSPNKLVSQFVKYVKSNPVVWE